MAKEFTDDTILARWLSGELTAEELQELENHPDFEEFTSIIEQSNKLEAPSFSEKKLWENIQSQTIEQKPKAKIRRLNWWKVAAAASIILVVSWFFLLRDGAITKSTGIGEQLALTLPSGSAVTLNAASSVTYDVNTWKKDRILRLNGEAYFDVKEVAPAYRDGEINDAFIVETSQGKIEVLGTKFNVNTHDNTLKVACDKGKVRVTQNNTKIDLVAGESVIFQNGNAEKSTNPNLITPSWLRGESTFENVTLQEVIRELERQYEIKIEYDNSLNKRVYTGGFVHNDLLAALQMVFVPMSIEYQLEEKVVRLK